MATSLKFFTEYFLPNVKAGELAFIAGSLRRNFDFIFALGNKSQPRGRRIRKINDTAFDKRPTIIDSHSHHSTAAQALDQDIGSERQSAMSRGHFLRIKFFATGGAMTFEIGSIPRGSADLRRSLLERG